jgi:hypothetical protein
MKSVEHYAQLSNWVAPLHGGGYRLLDPENGQVQDLNCPPQFLIEDGQLLAGYNFLHKYGKAILTTIGYGAHSTAKDLGKKKIFEERVAGADIYLFEDFGWDEAYHAEEVAAARVLIQTEKRRKTTDFLTRIRLASTQCGTPSRPFDVEESDKPADQIIDVLATKFYKPAKANSLEENTLFNLMYLCVVNLPFANTREWYWVGQFGRQIQALLPSVERYADGSFPSEDNPLHVLATAGSAHLDFTRKLRLLGVPLAPEIWRIRRCLTPLDQKMSLMLSTGKADGSIWYSD